MAEGIVKLHRVVKASPDKVYRAFLDPDAICKWMPPFGFTCKVHQQEAKVGGTYKMSFINFSTGKSNSFGGKYIELKENEYIHNTDEFDDPSLPGTMHTKVTLKLVACGTEMSIIQEGIPESIPVEFCYLGWQESIEQLINLVEPNIPD